MSTSVVTRVDDTPFSILYTGIWNAVDPYIQDLVRPGNIIRYDTHEANPEKRNVQLADMPEVMLMSEGFEGNLTATSNSAQCLQRFAFFVSTGRLQYTPYLAQISFALYRGLLAWTEFGELSWKEKRFVKAVRLDSTDEARLNAEQNRGLAGFSSALRFHVEMFFSRADLVTLEEQ